MELLTRIPHAGRRPPVLAAIAAALLLTTGCATPGSTPYHQRIDEHTAATVTTVVAPVVFYADAPELAVNARDYLSVWAFEVKENAVRRLFLACELWSTIDRSRVPGIAPLPQPARITLHIEETAVPLRVVGAELRLVGLDGWPFPQPPHKGGMTVYLRVSEDQMRYLADSRNRTSVDVIGADGQSYGFTLWRDERAAIGRFLGELP